MVLTTQLASTLVSSILAALFGWAIGYSFTRLEEGRISLSGFVVLILFELGIIVGGVIGMSGKLPFNLDAAGWFVIVLVFWLGTSFKPTTGNRLSGAFLGISFLLTAIRYLAVGLWKRSRHEI